LYLTQEQNREALFRNSIYYSFENKTSSN